jgi:hypothetical protein
VLFCYNSQHCIAYFKSLSKVRDQQQTQQWREDRRFPANKSGSRPRNLQLRLNVTDTSERQRVKQCPQTTSTEAGIWIEVTPLSENAKISDRDNLQFRSNATDVSDVHSQKYDSEISTIDDGIHKRVLIPTFPGNFDKY